MRRPAPSNADQPLFLAAWVVLVSVATAVIAADPTVSVSFTEATLLERSPQDAAHRDTKGRDTSRQPERTIAAVGLRAVSAKSAAHLGAASCDVIVLVDTSASQVGNHRRRGLEAVSAILAAKAAENRAPPAKTAATDGSVERRFLLAAIDVDAEPLARGFTPGGSAENRDALQSLETRTPLGTTDLVEGLLAVVPLFEKAMDGGTTANDDRFPRRRIIYVGDGPGIGSIDAISFRGLLETLRSKRIGFSAVGLGDRVNWPCLAAIANATGGMLAVPDDKASAAAVGGQIADMAAAAIFWPDEVVLSSESHDAGLRFLPERLPPLRTDRDTVVLVEGLLGKVRLEMSLATESPQIDGPQIKVPQIKVPQRAATTTVVAVDVPEVAPKSDNAYLAELVRNASTTGGIFLPTLGREGLELSRAAVREEAAVLAGLGRQAEAAGASDAALRLANASLRRDPDNAEAAVVRAAAARPEDTKIAARLNAADDENPFDAPDDAGGRPAAGGGRAAAEIEPLPARPPRRPAAAVNQEPDELRQAEKMRRVRAGRLEQETAVRLRDARTKFPTDPDAAGTDLKSLLQEIAASDDLDAGLRDRLRRQVEMRIREADVRSREKQQRDLDAEQRRTAAREKVELVNDLNRREQRFKALTERYDALVEEGIRTGYQRPTGSFIEAERVVADGPGGLAETAPNIFASQGMPMTARVIGRNAPLFARMLDYDAENSRIRRDIERGFMDTMNLVDVAAIPFSGDPPVIYPSADRWREITRLREKYKSVDLANPSGNEQRINESLEKQVESLKFDETPLRDVIAAIEDKQGLQLELDTRALEDAGLDLETPITRNVSNISLRSALRLLLSDLDLTYIIKDEVLLITTKEKAGENLVVKVYPVADLVLPVNPSSGLNPFQTGGGLGGAGGLNSGMGGVMGAGGAGAGGMGGMGGGGLGGGMFQIADARAVASTGERAGSPRSVEGLPQTVLEGNDLRTSVSDYLRQAGSPAETEKRLAQLRRSARDLGERESFAKAADLLCGSILAGHAEPWMYEALAAAAEAAGWERRQVERVLLSSADFATTPTDLLALAQYLGRSGSPARAISMCRRVVRLDPTNREAYALAMTLAAKAEDMRALEWSCVGVLSHDWPTGQEAIATRAARLAKMTIEKLSAAGRGDEAKAFKRAIDEALVRDLEVTVTWGGDADVDMIVEDPTGAACSPAAPRTASGGMLISDAARSSSGPGSRNSDANEHRERYVCGEAFPGTYRMLVRRVWGEVEADTISVEMVIRRGTSREERLRKQMPIGAGDVFLNVVVPEGRRREPLDDARVAQDIVAQQTIGKAVLAQQLAGMNDASAAASLAQSRAAVSPRGTAGLPFFRQGAVGNQPVITTLPEGINLFARAVVSADRRYVRVTATPLFSSVGQVTTFQFSGGAAAAAGPAAGGPAAGGPAAGGPAAGGPAAGGPAAGGPAAGGAGAAAGGAGAAAGAVAGGAGAGGAVAGGAGAGGAVGGGFCWVAREVYGEANPKWMMFREWLTTRGPNWLLEIYRDHGEAFARWIHDKPAAKAAVRALMDRAIADLPSKAGERPSQGEPGPWPASE